LTFAGEGKRVAAVDRKYIRGSCPNIACLLSKNIIHGAKVVDYVRRSKKFGIAHEGFTVGRGQDFDRSVSVGKPAQGQRIERLPYGQELDTAR
jgi:pyruvate/2-oxoglutarate dehydrogenase complex dihydrolipoamide dehydrogenase (E3) component